MAEMYSAGIVPIEGMKTLLQQLEERTGKVPTPPEPILSNTPLPTLYSDTFDRKEQNVLESEYNQYVKVAEM